MHQYIGRLTFYSLPDRNFGLFVQECSQFVAKLTDGVLNFGSCTDDNNAWEVSITFEFTAYSQYDANKEVQGILWDLGCSVGDVSSFNRDWYLHNLLAIPTD